jgi:Xaa-Pro aminopeptidase
MKYKKIDNSFFSGNRKNYINLIKKNSVSLFFANDQQQRNGDQYFPFRQNSTFFYLTGIEQEKSILLLAPECPNESLREAIFLLKPEKDLEIWEGHKLTKDEAKDISGIKNVYWLDEFDILLKEALSYTSDVYLNGNEYVKFIPETESREDRLGKEIRNKFPLHNYRRAAPFVAKLRLVKSKHEIEILKKACDITNKAFRKVLQFTKPGVFEYEVEAEVTREFLRNGASGHGYAPIIASGKNACFLHYIVNDNKCADGDLLLMDFGAEYANYTADMSRTIPVNGKFTERQKALYNAVLNTLKEVKKLYVPGNTINDINKKTNELMEKEMIKLGLFTQEEINNQPKDEPLYKKYFMHGTAHFLGLDVHDVGSKTEPFKPGMVLTCEPGIYIPEENIGIRIENDILITENEPIDLMADFPIEIEEIETLMNL